MSHHVLNKFHLEVTAPEAMDGIQLQQDISEYIHKRLLRKLEMVFDQLGTHQHIRIPKLELNIQQLDEENWEEELEDKFTQQLMEELKHWKAETAKDKKDSPNSSNSSDWKTFLFFLKTGKLPWWSNSLIINNLKVFFQKEIKKVKDVRALQKLLASDQQALARFIFHTDDKVLSEVLEKILGQSIRYFSFYKNLKKGFKPWWHPRIVRLQIWKTAFEVALKNNTFTNQFKPLILEKIVQHFSQQKKQVKGKLISENVLLQKLETIFKKSKSPVDTTIIDFFRKRKNTPQRIIDKKTTTNWLLPNNKIVAKKIEILTTPNESLAEEGEYITNSGLIILHPFLQYLFEGFGITKNKVFVDEFQQGQAALFMQYLVTGEKTAFENDLLLNKILCEIPLDRPLETELVFEKEILQEGENLLQATIKHWKVLKNTSVEGLRSTFLQREGKIKWNEAMDSWQLHVSSTAVDILLSKLPWGIGLIKLPWMEKNLIVEW